MQQKNQLIVYPTSSDPFHQGHFNIEKKAIKRFGRSFKTILYQNPLKDRGLLSLTQRYKDMLITKLVYGIQSGKIRKDKVSECLQQIKNNIILPESEQDLFAYLAHAKFIIRGARSEQDVHYSKNLAKEIGHESLVAKGIFIRQDDSFVSLSSTKFKIAFCSFHESGYKLPKVYSFLDQEKIYNLCKQFSQQTPITIGSEDLKLLVGRIEEYTKAVSTLEESGWFENILL